MAIERRHRASAGRGKSLSSAGFKWLLRRFRLWDSRGSVPPSPQMKASLSRRDAFRRRNRRPLATGATSLIIGVLGARALEFISITGSTTYTQNFDSIGTASQAWADASAAGGTLDGW